RVDPRRQEGWWYEGGGIYRHVWLNAADPVHVAPWGTFVHAEVRGPEAAPRPAADVTIETTVVNVTPRAQNCILTSNIAAPHGHGAAVLRTPHAVPARGSATIRQLVHLHSAMLWSLETPYLYEVRASLEVGGRAVDQPRTQFGIRRIRFDAEKGFFLNG